MRKFDTKIQYLKYKVLREVARYGFEDNLDAAYYEIPKLIVKEKPTMRCCIYKERAIVEERIKLAMGGDKKNPNVIEVIEIACDECPVSGHVVTESCRGCLAHRCEDVCRRGAITFDEQQKAHIDKSKCVECGQCAKVCPYSAIINQKRPCEKACKIKAISMSSEEHRAAHIDNEKCISCGACVYQCPFGALSDKSFILDAIDLIKKSDNNRNYKVYAIVAPSISAMGVSPVLVGLAICFGAVGLSLPNDSGFWVVNRFSGFSFSQTMKSWTLGGFAAGLTGLVVILILSLFQGVLPGLM